MATVYLCFVVGLLVAGWLFDLVVEWLNLRHVSPEIPEEFVGVYDAEKYATSQRYLAERTRLGFVSGTVAVLALVAFILLGGFGWWDRTVSAWVEAPILRGLLFAGGLVLMSMALSLPFSIYSTFGIEERYGFNKTTPRTFVLDLVKSLALGAVLGGAVFAMVVWFFQRFDLAWLYAWIAVMVLQLVILYVAPVWIMPLFNKFEPLEDGELKSEIETYAAKQRFALSGIFKMDGSKRSTKSNAYFTGFGKMRRIVLFDTLIDKHTVPELVSVLAHEVGHYKLRHIHKMLLVATVATGLMFFVLKLFVGEPALYEAFGLVHAEDRGNIYAGIVLFGFLYAPISSLLGVLGNVFSRKHEFEADAYAVETAGQPQAMVDALKKLSVDNLSNLTPHPLKVFLEYSHPPVLKRIEAIRARS